MKTPDGTSTREGVEEVRDDRNRRREQLALERLAKAPEAEEEAEAAAERAAEAKAAAERAKEEARL